MPTKYAEVIYETGSHAVLSYENIDDLKSGLLTQHQRAVKGEVGGPTGHPAERVTKVLLYDEHPADYNASGTISAKDLASLADSLSVGGQISANELTQRLAYMTSPVVLPAEGRHDSIFVAPSTDELALDFLKEGE